MRLGCASAAIAQIMFFHRRCPTGAVSYVAPGYGQVYMNFTAEAATLCDWGSFALAPPNVSSDPAIQRVARFEYAAALAVEKLWGTGTYALSHEARAASVSARYGVNATRLTLETKPNQRGAVSRAVMVAAIVDSLQRRLPMKLQIGDLAHVHFHHVVVDGFELKSSTGQLMLHLNIGHSGYDDGWSVQRTQLQASRRTRGQRICRP